MSTGAIKLVSLCMLVALPGALALCSSSDGSCPAENPEEDKTVMLQSAVKSITVSNQNDAELSATSKLTDAQKTAVVARHNKLRSEGNAEYQPCTASDMEAMVWDDKLGEEAQAWADGCVGDHAHGAGSDFGENLYMSFPQTAYTTDELASGVDDWYSEIKDSVWNIEDRIGSSKPGATVGHYWQVIWAKSNRVGCGVKSCKSSLTIDGAEQGSGVLMVCRYQSPASLKNAGDTNSLPFIFGKPCGACPNDCDNGLCTAAPIRCLDKLGGDNTVTIGSTKFSSCADIVKPADEGGPPMPWCTMLAAMMQAEESCLLSCGKCTVPEGVGKEWCNGGTGPAKKDKSKEKHKIKEKQKTDDKNQEGGKGDDGRKTMQEKMREQMKKKMQKRNGANDDEDEGPAKKDETNGKHKTNEKQKTDDKTKEGGEGDDDDKNPKDEDEMKGEENDKKGEGEKNDGDDEKEDDQKNKEDDEKNNNGKDGDGGGGAKHNLHSCGFMETADKCKGHCQWDAEWGCSWKCSAVPKNQCTMDETQQECSIKDDRCSTQDSYGDGDDDADDWGSDWGDDDADDWGSDGGGLTLAQKMQQPQGKQKGEKGDMKKKTTRRMKKRRNM